MNWHQRRVCVTGAGGFIGANLCLRLKELGAIVSPVDIVSWTPSWRVLHPGAGPLELVSLEYPNAVARMLDERAPDVIYHLAGVSHIANAQAAPRLACEINIRLAWNILDALLERKSEAIFIAASSNHVYGGSQLVTFDEGSPMDEAGFYGATKACQDLLVRAYRHAGLRARTLRHVNAYGPADPYTTHLVTGTVLNLLEGIRPMLRGDGSARKGYLYIDDVVNAYIAAALLPDGEMTWYNVSPHTTVSALEMVQRICAVANIDGDLSTPVIGGDDEQRGYEETLDSTAFRLATGWDNLVDLEDGLARTIAWYREHRDWIA